MLKFIVPRGVWLPFVLITLSFASVFPHLYREQTNIVTKTYQVGTLRFWNGTDPYKTPVPDGDRYEYSPFFAQVYVPFTFLPPRIHALTWALLNISVFWIGLCAWIPIGRLNRWVIFALVAISLELPGPVLYQQINALLAGLLLLGLARVRNGRWVEGGMWLTVATNFKLLPGPFALALLYPFRKKYFVSLAVTSIVCLLAPAICIGIWNDIYLHRRWIETLSETATLMRIPSLDVFSVTMSHLPSLVAWMIVISCWISFLYFFVAPSLHREKLRWESWTSLGLCCITLLSPRTETPTFILMTPSFLLIALALTARPLSTTLAAIIATLLAGGFFLVTLSFNDLWPRSIWNPHSYNFVSKTYGVILVWLATLLVIGQELADEYQIKVLFRRLSPLISWIKRANS